MFHLSLSDAHALAQAVYIFQNSSHVAQHVVHYSRDDQHIRTLHPRSFLSFHTAYLNFLDHPF